jgi:DNA topoisomerase I
MDKSASKAKPAPPGISIRHGPVNGELTNGTAKRKSRASIDSKVNYKDESDSDDGVPMVRHHLLGAFWHHVRCLSTTLG